MELRVLILAASVLILMYADNALPNPPTKPTLKEVATAYKNKCVEQQAPLTYCLCIADKIVGIHDPALADKMVSNDRNVGKLFFDRAIQECQLDDMRNSLRDECMLEAAAQSHISFDAQAACRCLDERVRELDDQVLIDDSAAIRSNEEARARDSTVKPYENSIERLRRECEQRHRNRR